MWRYYAAANVAGAVGGGAMSMLGGGGGGGRRGSRVGRQSNQPASRLVHPGDMFPDFRVNAGMPSAADSVTLIRPTASSRPRTRDAASSFVHQSYSSVVGGGGGVVEEARVAASAAAAATAGPIVYSHHS